MLAANAGLQAMYAQYNVNGNEYLLLECFVDVQKDNTAIGLDEKKSVHDGQEYIGLHVCCQWKDEGWFYVMGKVIRCEGITLSTDG